MFLSPFPSLSLSLCAPCLCHLPCLSPWQQQRLAGTAPPPPTQPPPTQGTSPRPPAPPWHPPTGHPLPPPCSPPGCPRRLAPSSFTKKPPLHMCVCVCVCVRLYGVILFT